LGVNSGQREFPNSLTPSRHFGEWGGEGSLLLAPGFSHVSSLLLVLQGRIRMQPQRGVLCIRCDSRHSVADKTHYAE
jgi:hypothetical protein